jgi:hypothetical protein
MRQVCAVVNGIGNFVNFEVAIPADGPLFVETK